MNSIFKIAVGFLVFTGVAAHAWEIDFSRRTQNETKHPTDVEPLKISRSPASAPAAPQKSPPKLLEDVFKSSEPVQDIVILNTEKGFIPETIRLKKDGRYKITLVNVNEKEKNVSFILDAFSESHATYFGQTKSFEVMPKTDGIFSFICPETEAKGRMVIYSGGGSSPRSPASE